MGMVLVEVTRVVQAGVNPRRITQALDLCGLYGPEVDVACGGAEPMVDEWEAGARTPTGRQLRKLAALTGFPPAFFAGEDPPDLGRGWLCVRSGAGKGCYTGDGLKRPEIAAQNMPRFIPAPVPPPLGVLPECGGCAQPMRRQTWTAQSGRCTTCGPTRGNPHA